jgi:hypothetical protein
MRLFAGAILLPLILFPVTPQSGGTFPIPGDMREIWPGAKLSEADKPLLQEAVNASLRDLHQESKSPVDFDSAEIALGPLGKGVIVLLSSRLYCGTGDCPIFAYVREKTGYRIVLSVGGWAFAVVDSHDPTPDLVIARNAGGGLITLLLFRYSGKTFNMQACEILTSKTGDTPNSWWDPSLVNIGPCAQQ